ncbi:MAG: PAS domain S-box protein [Desulfuromonadales bacterium]|nr:PAS domain S-box protein [Desulfuromonadales bacterium]MBN2793640.1 PAS domain S-box protein [Desulfuromonadales bacterium]
MVFSTSPDPIALTRIDDGTYLDVNEGFVNLSGYTKEQLIGKSSLEMNIWRNHRDRSRFVANLLEKGRVENFETEFVGRSGRVIYGLMSGRIIEIDGEKLLLTITRDITTRKLTEEKYSTLINEANIGICLAEANSGEILDVNNAFLQMMEYDRDEVIGQSQAKFEAAPISHGSVTAGFVEHRDHASGEVRTRRMRTKSGKILEVDIKASRLKISDEDLLLGFFQDVSERKNTLELLRNSEIRFKDMTNLLPEAVYETDLNLKVTYANLKALELFGYEESDLESGLYVTSLIAPEYVDFSHLRVQRIFSGKSTESQEYQCLKKDGTVFPVLLHSDAIFNDGKPVGLRGVIIDLTQRKQDEEELLKLRKLESIGVLAGGVAHNFNNSLAAIIGSLEMAKRKIDQPDKVRHFLDTATKASFRARDLVSQILKFSRQEEKAHVPINLPHVVEETLALVSSTLPATTRLNYRTAADLFIRGDSSQIQECLLNLCNNAVQAMAEEGEIDIRLQTVSLEQVDIPSHYECRPGHYVQLSVKDTGCGMEQKTLEKIFDPFFTTKGIGEGTGMGLATVQGLVNQHGGLIKVRTKIGKGSTFELYFPLIETPRSQQAEKEVVDPSSHRERILFIDDDETLTDLGHEILTDLGYRVSVSLSGREGLEIFASKPNDFDLLITDQTMPGLTGKELIFQVKKIRPDIRTILLTGYSSKIDKEQAEQAGIDAFCMKPLSVSELSQTIESILNR